MTINIYRGPFIYIPDKLHPGSYKMVKNPDWDGDLPDIITFTEFLKWNYTLDYGQYIRKLHEYRTWRPNVISAGGSKSSPCSHRNGTSIIWING